MGFGPPLFVSEKGAYMLRRTLGENDLMAKKPPPQAKMGAIKEAARLFRSGQIDAAQAFTFKALKKFPESHELYEIFGHCCIRKQQFKPAVAAFREIVKRGKGNRTIYVNLAKANYELGRYETAERLLLKVQAKAPGDRALSVLLGDVAVKQGRLDAALAHFDHAAAEARFEAEARSGKARILTTLQRLDEAVEEDRLSIALKARGAAAATRILNYPTAVLRKDDLALAEKLIASKDTGGKPPSSVLHGKAMLAYHRGDLVTFAAQLKEANALKLREAGKAPSERPFFDLLNQKTDEYADVPMAEGETDGRVLLIVGPSTSGKSTVEAMLVTSDHMIPRYEAFNKEALRRMEEVWPERPDSREVRNDLFFLRKDEQGFSGKTVLCTLPAIVFRLPILVRMIPDLYVLHIEKDPLQLTVDILSKYYSNGNLYSYDLAATQEYVDDYQAYMARIAGLLGDRYLKLHQSDIGTDPQGSVARIEQMLGQDLGIDAAAARPRLYPQPEGYYETMADLLGISRGGAD